MISPLLLSHSLFFVFGHVVSFSGVGSRSSCHGCSTVSCDFSGLVGRAEGTYFYSIILNQFGALFLFNKWSFGIGSIPSFWYVIQECMSLTIGFCLSKTILHLCLRKVTSPNHIYTYFFQNQFNATNIYWIPAMSSVLWSQKRNEDLSCWKPWLWMHDRNQIIT